MNCQHVLAMYNMPKLTTPTKDQLVPQPCPLKVRHHISDTHRQKNRRVREVDPIISPLDHLHKESGDMPSIYIRDECSNIRGHHGHNRNQAYAPMLWHEAIMEGL